MISQKTFASLTALAINWVYWEPKSRIRIFSVIAAKIRKVGSLELGVGSQWWAVGSRVGSGQVDRKPSDRWHAEHITELCFATEGFECLSLRLLRINYWPITHNSSLITHNALQFQLEHTDIHSGARAGKISTDHGEILTPMFMPVGTVGSVKAVTQQQLKNDIKAQIILGNTYHLYLRPGLEVLEKAGGLHQFMGWDKPLLTDSGGYQVFSLANNRKIIEEGVWFQSHIDGSKHLFTPEIVMDIQRTIGGDIIMAFDECPPYPSDYAYAKTSMELTHRWLDRCLGRLSVSPEKYGYAQNLFPIVQGGTYMDLRKASCEYISSVKAPGNAIGGLSVGEPETMMYEICAQCCAILPADKPRYLMGVGTPWNILENIALGIDMFDCVIPTRNGRNAMLFTSKGVINIDNLKWASDFSPLDDGIDCEVSNHYTKAYLRHLMKSKEILGLTIASVHNLAFYLHLVTESRKHILQGDYIGWKNEQVEVLRTRL